MTHEARASGDVAIRVNNFGFRVRGGCVRASTETDKSSSQRALITDIGHTLGLPTAAALAPKAKGAKARL